MKLRCTDISFIDCYYTEHIEMCKTAYA